jgi:hypothetical protein
VVDSAGARFVGAPHTGCFIERAWICLIPKELYFFTQGQGVCNSVSRRKLRLELSVEQERVLRGNTRKCTADLEFCQ